jgi:hypothetical protein
MQRRPGTQQILTSRLSPHPPAAAQNHEPAQRAHFLYRPIVFDEPQRIVHPGSWIEHIPFAFWITDVLRPAVFVELGTQSGNSYSSFAQAVQTLGLPTTCYAIDTWRGDSQAGFYDEGVFTEWSAYHDRHFSAFSRLIRSSFAEAVHHFSDASIDLLHIDGCHTYEALSADLQLWRPKVSRRGVILMHDINVRERDFGAWRVWQELKERSPSFEFLHGNGLGVLAVGTEMTEPLQWLLSRRSVSNEDVSAVRQFFARLGGTLSARFAAEGAVASSALEAQAALAAAHIEELRDHLSSLEADLAARDVQVAADALRLASLEDDLSRERQHLSEALERQTQRAAGLSEALERKTQLVAGLSEALERKTQLAAGLQARLTTESDLRQQADVERRQAEAELDRLKGASQPQSSPRGRGLKPAPTRGRLRRSLSHLRSALVIPSALGLLPSAGRRMHRSAVTFITHPTRLAEAYAISRTGLFNEAYYRWRYADVARSRLSPLAHFVLIGGREGRSPHPLFDSAYYLRRNPDVAVAGANPVLHYWTHGALEERNPHPLFDIAYYLGKNPSLRNAAIEPLTHFLRFGGADASDPNPFFDCSYYSQQYPDVAASQTNPLVHFVIDGWREGRRPSERFDTLQYLADHDDIRQLDVNPLSHYVEFGQFEKPNAASEEKPALSIAVADVNSPLQVKLKVHGQSTRLDERPTVLCLSHVMPVPPRAGNEYRIYRMLCWLRDRGYRIVPLVSPLADDHLGMDSMHALADEFSNAVVCDRHGRLEYILGDVPDVLASLDDEFTQPFSILLDEDAALTDHQRALLQMDRTFCHDALIAAALRLHAALPRYILLSEYIWMSRILPLIPRNVPKVIDTIDVFSTKREKVLRFGIEDLHVEPEEEAKRLRYADLILAIQDDEGEQLRKLMPGKPVVTAGVDFDVVEDGGAPIGRRLLYVASDNPMNRKGLQDFLRFAWPQIRRDVPDAEMLLAGKICRTLEVMVPGVIQLGPVQDLRPLYQQARVIINPAIAGTGLKIKTLEALGHFRPIVTWPNGTDGLAPELAALCLSVQDWYDFSRRVTNLLVADAPPLFTEAERAMIVRLTSAATAYGAMTEALDALWQRTCESDLERIGDRA